MFFTDDNFVFLEVYKDSYEGIKPVVSLCKHAFG